MDYISYLKQKVYENVSHLYIGSQLKSLWKKVPGKLFPLLTSSWIVTFIKEKEREKERFSGQSRKRKSSDAQAAVHFPSRRWILLFPESIALLTNSLFYKKFSHKNFYHVAISQ